MGRNESSARIEEFLSVGSTNNWMRLLSSYYLRHAQKITEASLKNLGVMTGIVRLMKCIEMHIEVTLELAPHS